MNNTTRAYADNDGMATIAGVYAQDQIAFSQRWKAVVGLRFERFGVDFHNRRTNESLTSVETQHRFGRRCPMSPWHS